MQPYKTIIRQGKSESLSSMTGLENPHIEAVTVIQGPLVQQINGVGFEEFRAHDGRSLSGRGSCVCLTFHDEEGHRSYVTYQFHKGSVTMTVSEREPMGEHETPIENYPPQLWRD